MRRKPGMTMLLVFFLVFISTIVLAKDREIKAVFVSWEPFGFIDNGKVTGFELDIFSAVAKDLKIEVSFDERPWKRCLYLVKHQFADVIISALKTSERELYLYYPTEFISISNTALFTTVDRNIQFNGSFDSIKGLTVGMTMGFSYGSAFDRTGLIKKETSTKTKSIISKLMARRYKLGIGNIAVISSLSKKMGVRQKIRFLKPQIHSQKLFAAFSKAKGNDMLAREFSEELKKFKKTKKYRNILHYYGITNESQSD